MADITLSIPFTNLLEVPSLNGYPAKQEPAPSSSLPLLFAVLYSHQEVDCLSEAYLPCTAMRARSILRIYSKVRFLLWSFKYAAAGLLPHC